MSRNMKMRLPDLLDRAAGGQSELPMNVPVERHPKQWNRRAATLLRGLQEQLERQTKGTKQ